MRIGRGLFLGLLALPTLCVPASAAPSRKAVVHHDWSHTFSVSGGGGFVIGNPDAKIAILEYGSLTCPHCRHFAETAYAPLISQYVRTGKASYEFRSLVLNGIDVAATLVARCGGPSHFFPIAAQLYATQPTWVGKITEAETQKLSGLPQDQVMLGVAKATGLIPIASAHGIPVAKAEACVTSQPAEDELAKMAQAATAAGVTGTPTFFVNGKQVEAYDWATLEPFLKDSGG
jgi:protein-disulfide isomerase